MPYAKQRVFPSTQYLGQDQTSHHSYGDFIKQADPAAEEHNV